MSIHFDVIQAPRTNVSFNFFYIRAVIIRFRNLFIYIDYRYINLDTRSATKKVKYMYSCISRVVISRLSWQISESLPLYVIQKGGNICSRYSKYSPVIIADESTSCNITCAWRIVNTREKSDGRMRDMKTTSGKMNCLSILSGAN